MHRRRKQTPNRLADEMVEAIRTRRLRWQGYRLHPLHPDSLASLSVEFGVSESMVSRIANFVCYKDQAHRARYGAGGIA